MAQEPEGHAPDSEEQPASSAPNSNEAHQEHPGNSDEAQNVPAHSSPERDDDVSEPEEQEEGGGPVKSFLEHLEDLRWTIIKAGASLIIAMVICLCATKQIVAFLTWPMERAYIPSTISRSDILDLPRLADRLKQRKDNISQYLFGRFSDATKKTLADFKGPGSDERPLRDALVQELNKVIEGELIYDASRLDDFKLSAPTLNLLRQNPQGRELVHLNRLLLEDAYPLGMAKNPDLDPKNLLQLLHPLGGFLVSFKMAFYAGLVLGLPFILYYIGQFVVPALKTKEKKFFFTAFSIGTGFFLAGVVVCYFFLLPFSLGALVTFNKMIGFSTQTWRAEEYFDFTMKFMLGVGFLFEVPVLLLSLIRLELIKHEWLLKGRSYMFVVNFALCAVLTPADLLTTFLMAFALQLIYEACILISKHWQRQKKNRLATEAGLAAQGSNQISSND